MDDVCESRQDGRCPDVSAWLRVKGDDLVRALFEADTEGGRRSLVCVVEMGFELVRLGNVVVANQLLESSVSGRLSFETHHVLLRAVSGLRGRLEAWDSSLKRLRERAAEDDVDVNVLAGLWLVDEGAFMAGCLKAIVREMDEEVLRSLQDED